MPGHLETLLAFDRQYQRDQQQSPAFLHRRDRRYRMDLDSRAGNQTPDIRHWLDQLQALSGATPGSATLPELRLWRRITAGFVAAGALLGVLTMSGLLYYDGGQQINVTVILGVILLQLLLALYTAVQGLAGWQPWAMVTGALLRRQPDIATGGPLKPLTGPLMARTAQLSGLLFGITGLITLLVSVVIQDLAFGWTTTLATSADTWHRVVSWIAAPWSGWLPAASPSLQLVEETRFFRLDSANGAVDPARWGAWWPFIAMAWLSWVILPRLLLLGVAVIDLRRKSRRALIRHPGYQALLWRMETPTVDTGAETADGGQLPRQHRSTTVPVPTTSLVVSWAGATAAGLLPDLSQPLARAGGNQSLQADRDTLGQLSELTTGDDGPLLVITRSWEPPTAELADFLEEATDHLPGRSIVLLPMAQDAVVRPDDQRLGQWLRFAERIGMGVQVAAVEAREKTS